MSVVHSQGSAPVGVDMVRAQQGDAIMRERADSTEKWTVVSLGDGAMDMAPHHLPDAAWSGDADREDVPAGPPMVKRVSLGKVLAEELTPEEPEDRRLLGGVVLGWTGIGGLLAGGLLALASHLSPEGLHAIMVSSHSGM